MESGTLSSMGHKTCSKCHLTLPLEAFYENPRGGQGRTSWCIKCMKKRQKRVSYQRVRYDSAETMARREVSKALRKGTIVKPSVCQSHRSSECSQTTSRLEAHHYKGYAPEHWTTIIWVCPACHTLLDDAMKGTSHDDTEPQEDIGGDEDVTTGVCNDERTDQDTD